MDASGNHRIALKIRGLSVDVRRHAHVANELGVESLLWVVLAQNPQCVLVFRA